MDDDRRVGGQKRRDDVAEVPRVGAEGDGRAVGGRLDHVLPAAAAEAAADEGDRRRAPPGAELADGIDEQDASRRAIAAGAARQFSCERRCHGKSAVVEQFGDRVEALGMARHEDQPQARMLR